MRVPPFVNCKTIWVINSQLHTVGFDIQQIVFKIPTVSNHSTYKYSVCTDTWTLFNSFKIHNVFKRNDNDCVLNIIMSIPCIVKSWN